MVPHQLPGYMLSLHIMHSLKTKSWPRSVQHVKSLKNPDTATSAWNLASLESKVSQLIFPVDTHKWFIGQSFKEWEQAVDSQTKLIESFLQLASQVRNTENWGNVYITSDLTKTEHDAACKAREELATHRAAEEAKPIIWKGIVVTATHWTCHGATGRPEMTPPKQGPRHLYHLLSLFHKVIKPLLLELLGWVTQKAQALPVSR